MSDTLVKVNLTIRSQDACKSKFNQRTDPKLHMGIVEAQLCAGGGSDQDTCQVREFLSSQGDKPFCAHTRKYLKRSGRKQNHIFVIMYLEMLFIYINYIFRL